MPPRTTQVHRTPTRYTFDGNTVLPSATTYDPGLQLHTETNNPTNPAEPAWYITRNGAYYNHQTGEWDSAFQFARSNASGPYTTAWAQAADQAHSLINDRRSLTNHIATLIREYYPSATAIQIHIRTWDTMTPTQVDEALTILGPNQTILREPDGTPSKLTADALTAIGALITDRMRISESQIHDAATAWADTPRKPHTLICVTFADLRTPHTPRFDQQPTDHEPAEVLLRIRTNADTSLIRAALAAYDFPDVDGGSITHRAAVLIADLLTFLADEHRVTSDEVLTQAIRMPRSRTLARRRRPEGSPRNLRPPHRPDPDRGTNPQRCHTPQPPAPGALPARRNGRQRTRGAARHGDDHAPRHRLTSAQRHQDQNGPPPARPANRGERPPAHLATPRPNSGTHAARTRRKPWEPAKSP